MSRALDRLVETGLVSRATAGSAYLYRLNDDHLAAPHVKALARLRDELDAAADDEPVVADIAEEGQALFGPSDFLRNLRARQRTTA